MHNCLCRRMGQKERKLHLKSFLHKYLHEREVETNWQQKRELFFFPQRVLALQSWLIAQDINRGIFAFSLYYKLNYQMRSLCCTVYNDIFLEVGIADYFKSRYNLPTVQCSYGITCHYKEFNFTFILHCFFSCVKYTYLYLDKSKLINI